MLNILDLKDIKMTGEARAKRLYEECRKRFERPMFDTELTVELARAVGQQDPDAARKIIEVMGGMNGKG